MSEVARDLLLENNRVTRYDFKSQLILAIIALFWRADREAEGARLLSEYTPQGYLGFESPALRQSLQPVLPGQSGFLF